jgi:hypothetical protein
MSSNGRTKGARSQKKTGFDPLSLLKGGSGENAAKLSDAQNRIFERAVQPEEKYEIPTNVPQREIILTSLETTLMDLIPARLWEYKKVWCFVWCTISSLLGTGGCLWAMGETVLFADQTPSFARLGMVSIMFIPFFCWFKVVFFPHGQERIHLDEMTEKRLERRKMEKKRYLHLEGRLPRPPKEVEIPDAPYEYKPREPWLYDRWKPKPKQYYYVDEDCVAHEAVHGSVEEAKEKAKEETLKELLSAGSIRNLAEAALSAMQGDAEGDIEEGGRKSSAQDSDYGRDSSILE